MNRAVWTIALILGICGCICAQDKPKTECPEISVVGPAGIVAPGQIASYSAKIETHGKTYSLAYQWTISSGQIVRGQGTAQIDVIQPEASLTTTLEILGLPSECPNSASESSVGLDLPLPEKLDEFSWSSDPTLDTKLRNVGKAVGNNPSAQLYIFTPPDTKIRKAIREKLQNANPPHSVDPSRITFVDNASKNSSIQIWLVPPGATPPTKCESCELPEPSPTTSTCPKLYVIGPAGITGPGNVMTFTLNVSGRSLDRLTFDWTTSAGTIVEGQGTPSLKVRTPAAPTDITATVKVGGLPEGCSMSVSETTRAQVGDPAPIDVYGRLTFSDEKGRFGRDFDQYTKKPGDVLFIIIQAPGNGPITYRSRFQTIMLLLRELRISAEKYEIVDGGVGENKTTIYFAKRGLTSHSK